MPQETEMRMTRQRRVILDAVRRMEVHPTAEEVYKEVKTQMPRMSLATVYRNLDVLCRIGAIRRLDWAGSQNRFDGKMEGHYHIRCRECGRVTDISRDKVAVHVPHEGGESYTITGHKLELIGVCPGCKSLHRSGSKR